MPLRPFVLLLLAASLTGCAAGPRSVSLDRRRYNEAVEKTNREELLLNLVRLRYEDTPGNLRVSGVTTQRSWVNSANASGGFGPDALKAANLAAMSTWTERPTVTYSPGTRDQALATFRSLSTETLFVLSSSGWSLQRLWMLTVENVNGISNARGSSGPIPEFSPEYGRFLTLLESLQRLAESQGFEVSRKRDLTPVFPEIPNSRLSADDIQRAASNGFVYAPSKSRDSVVLNRVESVTILRFSDEARQSPEGRIVYDTLGLDPDEREFELELALGGPLSTGIQPPGERNTILITPRSLQQIMFFLSKGVEIPRKHMKSGIVRLTRNYDGSLFDWSPVVGCFHVKHSRLKPIKAAVSVPYRGYWFYVDDSDLNSRRSLMLLDQVFEAQVEVGGGDSLPTLTLPL